MANLKRRRPGEDRTFALFRERVQRADIGLRYWLEGGRFDKVGAALADHHYSRRKVGSPQFMPPGQKVILISRDERAVFGWWRPHPDSGLQAMNGLDGWTCSIFRNDGSPVPSSVLILDAELAIEAKGYSCGPSGLLSYVWDAKLRSTNPGYCFKCAGWIKHPLKPRSADGKKTLLWKPRALAGVAACGMMR